jgi:hypothetical protein
MVVALTMPGAGHLMQGSHRKGMVFLVVLLGMFATGLRIEGQLFPLSMSEPLVFLGALAQWAVAGPRLVATMAGAGAGEPVAVTYEYGNTFLIVAGLLNLLIALDAWDLARGRQAR